MTVRLIDVPWNKALDIILKAHNFGKALEGNVLHIATVADLQAQENAAAALTIAQIENRPLTTFTRAVSYGNAQQISTIVKKVALSRKGDIIIDPRTNTLIVTEVDIPEYKDRILDLIKTLDTATPQVEIEARVVSTDKNFARSFGIQWGFNHLFDQTVGSTTDLSFPNHGQILGDLLQDKSGGNNLLPRGGWAVNLPSAAATGKIGLHLANITDQFQLDIALAAAESENKAKVLSAPKVTTLSNLTATITSGLSIPVQTFANNTLTITYQNAALTLTVKPQVTADNTILLEVSVNNASPGPPAAGGNLQINNQSVTTNLIVPDGGTAVLGGVYKLSEADTQDRLPLVSQLPLIGWLFKNRSVSRVSTELLIFITPKIKRPLPLAGGGLVPTSVSPAGN